MRATDLQELLHQQIPMAHALQVKVANLTSDMVELTAPLAPNGNHMGTAFGGSLGAIAILSCYAWLFNRLDDGGKECHVLIKSSHMDYIKPVTGDLHARCVFKNEAEIERVLQQFSRKGTARLYLEAEVIDAQKQVLCHFRGEFVARRK